MSNVVLSDFKGSGQFPQDSLVENHERFQAFVGSKIDEFSWEQFYVLKPHQQCVNWRTNNLLAQFPIAHTMTFQLIPSPQGHQVSNWPPPPPNSQGVFPHPSPCGHLQHIPPSCLHHNSKVVPPLRSCRLPHPMGMAPIPTTILPMPFVPIHTRKSMDWVKYKEGGDPDLM
jgi:hypothetical protein